MDVTVREARADDADLIAEMTLVAVNWDSGREALSLGDLLARPDLLHYFTGWPREGDLGVVAEVDRRRIGAAWLRRFGPDEPGYGFVAGDIPELSIGVVAGWRWRGVGGRLVDALLEAARERGIAAVSLSVERANPAVALYRSRGFEEVAGDAGAITMLVDLKTGL